MHNYEEPIVTMARYLYNEALRNIATPGDPLTYEQLPFSAQYYWQKVAAGAWETYWRQREFMENPTGRTLVPGRAA